MTTITAMPTRSALQAEAERMTAAAVKAQDTAVLAVAELVRQCRGRIYEALAASKHGLVLEEVAAVIDNRALAETLLEALKQDGEVSERQGVFAVTALPGAA
ncbi:MAG: hypothetical protein AB7I32_01050 [Gammaproteobacteria bacterium]